MNNGDNENRKKFLQAQYDPAQFETKWYSFWEEQGFFTANANRDKIPFTVMMPPPNVTGVLHIGHALTATIQDIITRFKRMNGYNALWLPGTDHAGIATQMVIERELKKNEKKTKYNIGRKAFLEKVWDWKKICHERITQQHKRLGISCDWSRERFTLDDTLSFAVRTAFVKLYEKNLIYRDSRLINWCPRCQTALSDLEVKHKDIKGKLYHIRYPLENSKDYVVVATTRPETLLGDTAVAVHPEDERHNYKIGKNVLLPLTDRKIPIIGDSILVDREFGTGAVKVTPAHDFSDFETGKRNKLSSIPVIDEKGFINKNGYIYQGLERFEARKKIVEDLQAQELLEKVDDYLHSVGHCQRCETIVEPYLSAQWFVKTKPLAEPAIQAVRNHETKFIPEGWEKTYYHWMENIQDWCISRQLWWGHQIPAWYCKDCNHGKYNISQMSDDSDSQKYWFDISAAFQVSLNEPKTCSKCGGDNIIQDDDVLDTWFSSGLWPFSTLGWPENTKDLQMFYPNSLMETGFDILFFWVARMMMMGIEFLGKPPFPVIYLHAMVRDEKGEKMSKTRGNVIDPLEVIDKYGTDALRFTLAIMAAQGRDIKLSMDRVNGYKAFFNKIWNAAKFVFMNVEDLEQCSFEDIIISDLRAQELWILHRLQQLYSHVITALDEYRLNDAAQAIYQFFWHEYCDWYIEFSKAILSLPGKHPQRKNVQNVHLYVLRRSLELLHPFAPFITEEIWQILPKNVSVSSIMLTQLHEATELKNISVSSESIKEIELAIEFISAVRTIRGESQIPHSKYVDVWFKCVDVSLERIIKKQQESIEALAKTNAIQFYDQDEEMKGTALLVTKNFEVNIPLEGVIDIESELKRLKKEMQKNEQELFRAEQKLNNPQFAQNAPPEIIEKEKTKIEEFRFKQKHLQKNISNLEQK